MQVLLGFSLVLGFCSLKCDRVLQELMLMTVLIYGSEKIIWKEEKSRIRAVQMDNLRGLLAIRKMDSDK